MMKPAAIQAQLVDVRNVSAHRCVRLEIHVPVEQASYVMEAFGWPTAADPVPVAIARMDLTKAATAPREAEDNPSRKQWRDLPLPQQAGIRCEDETFRTFCRTELGFEDAPAAVRSACGIKSRSELKSNDTAADLWVALDERFYRWSHGARQ